MSILFQVCDCDFLFLEVIFTIFFSNLAAGALQFSQLLGASLKKGGNAAPSTPAPMNGHGTAKNSSRKASEDITDKETPVTASKTKTKKRGKRPAAGDAEDVPAVTPKSSKKQKPTIAA